MKKLKVIFILLIIFSLTLFTGCDIVINPTPNNGSEEEGNNGNTNGGGGTTIHNHTTVNFFTINDIHGQLITDADNNMVGLDKVSTIIRNLEKNDEYIKVSCGDMFQGSFFSNSLYGLPAIEWMNYEHFNCFVIGNHEFDWGLDKIASYKDGNLENGEFNEDCEVLGCNIYLKSTNKTPDWIDSYSIEECNGYKVGVIGCIGEGLTSSIAASMCADYVFVDPVPLVQNYAKILRDEKGCDVVVVAIHDYNTGTSNDRFASLSGSSRIDAIICGHTHTQEAEYLNRADGYQIPVIECYGNNSSVGTIQINMKDNAPVSKGKISHYQSSRSNSDNEAYQLLYKYYASAKKVGDEVIGYTTANLSKEQLGNMGCSALSEYFDAEVGICNTGGIRSAIPSGDITFSDLYKTIPFDNTVFVITIKGSNLRRAINSSLYTNIDDIDNNKIYKVAIISYVYENYDYFSEYAISSNDSYILFRDILMNYIKAKYPKR